VEFNTFVAAQPERWTEKS